MSAANIKQQLYQFTLNEAILQIRKVVPDVSVRSLFSGYGFYLNHCMFAIWQEGLIYLRAEDELATELESHGARLCPYSSNQALSVTHYYCLPKQIFTNIEKVSYFLMQSIQQIDRFKENKKLDRLKKIRALPNLGIKHERLLIKVGIHDVEQLSTIGAEKAYILLKKQGYEVNQRFYWHLFAALNNQHVHLLDLQQKQHAVQKLNKLLKTEGLRAEKLLP